jgi:flagellar basal body-associated protein FliL
MRKGPLLAYLFIMLAALVGYMFLDMNISRAENQAGDSMKMAVITMLQSECSVNIQAMDRG